MSGPFREPEDPLSERIARSVPEGGLENRVIAGEEVGGGGGNRHVGLDRQARIVRSLRLPLGRSAGTMPARNQRS